MGGRRSGLRNANCVGWSGRRSSSAIDRKEAIASGKLSASKLKGMALRGPARSRSCRSKCTSLSPPRPVVRTSTASTIVRQMPTRAPSPLITGRPFETIAMSVVVPPISETTKF